MQGGRIGNANTDSFSVNGISTVLKMGRHATVKVITAGYCAFISTFLPCSDAGVIAGMPHHEIARLSYREVAYLNGCLRLKGLVEEGGQELAGRR